MGATLNAPIVATTDGRVSGEWDCGLGIFKGIPYGAPTGGANRFLPPQPVPPWSGVRRAVELGPGCPTVPSVELVGNPVAMGAQPSSSSQDEDCLSLNVWTPAPDDGRRPVMVWWHGG